MELELSKESMVDPVWAAMRTDAERWVFEESALASWLNTAILDQNAFQDSLAFLLSEKLGGPELSALSLYQVIHEIVNQTNWIVDAARDDLSATYERDPACTSYLEPFIFFKGYQALQAYRISHCLWN